VLHIGGGEPVETAEEAELTHKASEHMASWQVFPDEPWDIEPANERVSQTFEVTAQHLERLLYNTPPYTFQHSFAKEVASRYPVALVATINEQLGTSLTSSHIEDFWNHHINNYITSLREQLGDDFSLDRVSALFTRLLAEYMLDDDRVELHIPPELDGKLHGMGAELQTGELILYGNVGDFTGHRMNGMASIMVNGSTGDFTAFESAGYASLEVMGDAGHFAGSRLTEAAYLHVHGSVGDYCGQGLKGIDAYIEVDGNAGSHVGDNALRGVIDVRGVGESAQSNSSAVVNGEFAEWEAKDMTRVPVSLGKLAVHPSYDTEVIKQVLTPQPKDPQATIAEMEAAAQSVNPSLLEHAMPAPMQAELPPERLTFSHACEWFGVSAERLNECLEEIGHMRDSDLTNSDIGAMSELYEDLQVETVPTEDFISIEKVIEKFKIRKTPTQLLQLLAKKNVPLYKFRDVDGCVKHFISNENL